MLLNPIERVRAQAIRRHTATIVLEAFATQFILHWTLSHLQTFRKVRHYMFAYFVPGGSNLEKHYKKAILSHRRISEHQ